MGCVQSLFNPSKSRSPSPEEFVPPTFETVVVTRQPQKSESAKDEGAVGWSAGDGYGEGAVGWSAGDGYGDDDAADVASKCDDFERHAMEDGGVGGDGGDGGGNGVGDDNHSVHYVEATAVRTLAANTGSVAILGTTAKCKSVDGSPVVHQPLTERQRTWSPSAMSERITGSKSQPQLDVRCVEATAVRMLAADTGSIAILGTTADPKPQPHKPPADKDADALVHYVQATAARHLAAETGSIAILASTAEVSGPGPQESGHADVDLIPVGVREVLDSGPGQLRQVHEDRPEGEPRAEHQVEPEQRPLIPLPVIYAMEMKPGAVIPEDIFKTVKSSSVEKPHYPPEESTAADDGDVGAMSSSVSDALSKKPLVRQSNKTSDQTDNDDILLFDVWMPKVPVFAKCPPAKSKSLPSRDPIVANAPTAVDGKGEKQHGVIRGSSLPYDNDNSKTEQLTNSPKRKDKEGLIETKFDSHVIESNTTKPSEIGVEKLKQDVLGLNEIKSSEYNPKSVESNKVKPTAVDLNKAKTTVAESNKVESTTVELNEAKPNDVEGQGAMKPNGVYAEEVESIVIGSNAIESDTTATKDVLVGAKGIEAKGIEAKGIEAKGIEAKGIEKKGIEAKGTIEYLKFENEPDEEENADETAIGVDGKRSENEMAAGGPPASSAVVVDEKLVVVGEGGGGKTSADLPTGGTTSARDADKSDGGKTRDVQDPEDDANAEYRLTMIQSVREAVNRICEQAVEKTAAIVRSGRGAATAASGARTKRDATDDSDAADYASSEFSLPPPPPQPSDTTSTGQESSWPPPPPLSEAEEERTIAPGFSFDLPDPPTEMDQIDSETDKLDISDEEMIATGLPSDEDDKTDTGEAEADDYDDDDDDNGNIVAMKSTSGTVAATATAGGDDGTAAEASDGGAGDRAATTIQAVYRGFRARKYVETVNAAAVKIQAGFRGYRVRQSLKNAASSTTTTTTDDSQCWSDDDQKSVVSVTYMPLKESGGGQPVSQQQRGGLDGDGDGDDDDDDDDDPHMLQTGDDEVFERDDDGASPEAEAAVVGVPSAVQVQGGDGGDGDFDDDDDDDDVEALTNAAVKIQARVRGFAARKRLNDEKNGAGSLEKK